MPTLNAAISTLSQWSQPLLMLVGNHDQVSLGGKEHALTPLAACSPRVHVFGEPTVWADALWLPYRHSHDELLSALRSSPAVKAIFAHADVKGASLNDAVQALDGLEPSCFPGDVPIYTGHYHKPHRVPGSNIHYIGSPYQGRALDSGFGGVQGSTANTFACTSYPNDAKLVNTSRPIHSFSQPKRRGPKEKADGIGCEIMGTPGGHSR